MRRFLFILSLLIWMQGYSQRFDGGVIIGISANQIDGDYYSGYNKAGYVFTTFARLRLNRNYSLQSGVSLIQKGAHSPPKQAFFRTVINEAEVPLWLNIHPYPHLGATVGLNFGYIYKAYYESTTIFTKDDLGIGDLDLSYYFGLRYKIGKRLIFRVAHRYGLLPITRPITGDCWKNSIYMFWLNPYPVTQPCMWTNTVTVSFEIKSF